LYIYWLSTRYSL